MRMKKLPTWRIAVAREMMKELEPTEYQSLCLFCGKLSLDSEWIDGKCPRCDYTKREANGVDVPSDLGESENLLYEDPAVRLAKLIKERPVYVLNGKIKALVDQILTEHGGVR